MLVNAGCNEQVFCPIS